MCTFFDPGCPLVRDVLNPLISLFAEWPLCNFFVIGRCPSIPTYKDKCMLLYLVLSVYVHVHSFSQTLWPSGSWQNRLNCVKTSSISKHPLWPKHNSFSRFVFELQISDKRNLSDSQPLLRIKKQLSKDTTVIDAVSSTTQSKKLMFFSGDRTEPCEHPSYVDARWF